MPYCYFDFETSSVQNLKSCGTNTYINCPSTRIISAAFMVDSFIISLRFATTGELKLPDIITDLYNTHTFVSHNGELFDELLYKSRFPIYPKRFEDTLHLARLAGYPGKLNELYKIICGVEKSPNTAMELLCKAKYGPQGKVIYPVGTKALWDNLLEYNEQDVRHLETVHLTLLKHLTDTEQECIRVHREINARGFEIDTDYVRRLLNEWHRVKNNAKDEISRITDGVLTGDDINSPVKVKKWLTAIGFDLPDGSLDRKTIDQILANPEEYQTDEPGKQALALLAQRQNAVRATVGKLESILNNVQDDSCIRHVIVYGGAQTTMRFSGRTIQPHNFPRGVPLDNASPSVLDYHKYEVGKDDDLYQIYGKDREIPGISIVANRNKVTEADVLSTLTRSVIRPRKGMTFCIADYMAIEARVLARLSNCDTKLNIYRNNGDPYKTTAAKIFGVSEANVSKEQRFIGKQVDLASGYQAGGAKIALMCKMFGADLAKVGLTGEICKQAYRTAYPEIPALWKRYNESAIYVVKNNTSFNTNYVTFYMEWESGFNWLCIRLPSGRSIRYRNARVINALAPWGQYIEQVVYDTPYGYPKKLYGGILTENIDQGISRDIMTYHMVKIPSVVLTVHDEIVRESIVAKRNSNLVDMCTLMSIPPTWMPDIPLGVEGFTSSYYTKVSPEKPVKYLDGMRIH